MTYYYPFKIVYRLTGSNHPAKFSKLPCAYHIWKLRAINVPWIPPWYFPAIAASFPGRYGIQQPCFRRGKRGSKQQDSILILINVHNSSHQSHVIQ